MSIVSLYCVFADADEAERIGRLVVEERLAACINILSPCRSIYRWEGRIEDASEVPALLKTDASRTDALIARIVQLHSYEIPAIAVWPVEHAPSAFADWVVANSAKETIA
ncbi:divalent-cation tolerance protein CutA [Sphingomonas swuensis]|uniref:Divalent-cation tolerance protein CutA n=1 Tax=Sphingomonas swuensis TaxID=977800 RepID=A0ABP7SWW8_9SPHN